MIYKKEYRRGCGFRKPGGVYLVAEGIAVKCGRLPFPLECCSHCGAGIKFARSWQWLSVQLLNHLAPQCNGWDPEQYSYALSEGKELPCVRCPLGDPIHRMGERCGLLWIGEKFYPKPSDWIQETQRQGVSRRIKTVPKGFELGKTWVAVAHLKAVFDSQTGEYKRGIFHLFKPTAIEYIMTGKETPEELEALEKRGITPVTSLPQGDFPAESQPAEMAVQ